MTRLAQLPLGRPLTREEERGFMIALGCMETWGRQLHQRGEQPYAGHGAFLQMTAKAMGAGILLQQAAMQDRLPPAATSAATT